MTDNLKQELSSVFLVRSEHLNHQGHLFGGDMMAEIDTVAYCLMRRSYGDVQFVTRAADFSFEKPAHLGDLVTFCARRTRIGRTSVTVQIRGCVEGCVICSASMVFVHVTPDGAAPLPPEKAAAIPAACAGCQMPAPSIPSIEATG